MPSSSVPFLTRLAVISTVAITTVSIRFSWGFRRRTALRLLNLPLFDYFVLRLTRFLLGYLIPPILVQYWYVWPTHMAQDGRPYFDHIKYVRRTRYGPHPREELDELRVLEDSEYHPRRPLPSPPRSVLGLMTDMTFEVLHMARLGFGHHPEGLPVRIGRVKKSAPAVLFGHGGGWVCQGTDVQLGQLPAIARCAQVSIFSFNYPLAPEDPFPCAVVSTLRALSYLRTHEGYSEVALLGESAGGNLVTMAALFVCNPPLLARLARETQTDLDRWPYPHIPCVVSWYSILDDVAWRGKPGVEAWQDDAWLWSGLDVVWKWYLGRSPLLEGKATICQWKDELHEYPPALILAGSYDPLGLNRSAQAAHDMLTSKGLESVLKIYNATHGFVGYPPAMQASVNGGDPSHWKENCAMATKATVDFFIEHGHGEREHVTREGVEGDLVIVS